MSTERSSLVGGWRHLPVLLLALVGLLVAVFPARSRAAGGVEPTTEPWVSPSALAVSRDGRVLFVASATSGSVLLIDTVTRKVERVLRVSGAPSGLAVSADGRELFVTGAGPESVLSVFDWREGVERRRVSLGAMALAPVLSHDGATAYVCDQFNHAVSVVDLGSGTETRRIAVEREPVTAALSPDGRFLFVGNHLPAGRSDVGAVSARVSVIELAAGRVVRELALPNGGNLIRDVRISPDGAYLVVTHTLARFQLPTTQVERGWMNANAITLIDVARQEIFNTVLLDRIERGAANPWALAWTADGANLLVTHAGTHELSVIDFPGLLRKLKALPTAPPTTAIRPGYVVSASAADVASDLSFLNDLRQTVALGGNGPRSVLVQGTLAFVGNYFSESLSIVDLGVVPPRAVEVRLAAPRAMSDRRRGEALFNDATLCLEHWQSCATCHSSEARVDALNWDLLNDGVSNAKNTKSLLRAHLTAPAMSLGVRANAEAAVRAGIHHILFTVQPPEVPAAIDLWLAGLDPFPSPYLVRGKLSAAAERGRDLFLSTSTGCSDCHPPPLYTNREKYPVGTPAPSDPAGEAFDTPTLLELWRTAPYLHDGSAASLREVVTQRNKRDEHGKTSHLTPAQIDDLVAFLLSL